MKDASVALYTYFSNQRQCENMKLFDLPKVQGQECEHAHSSSQRETRDFRPLEVKRFVEKLFLILSYLTKSNLIDYWQFTSVSSPPPTAKSKYLTGQHESKHRIELAMSKSEDDRKLENCSKFN